MTLVFDTSAFSHILGGDKNLAQVASQQQYTKYILPLAADAELRFGFKHGTREQANLMMYAELKAAYGVVVAEPDHDTALIYAELATWCHKNGISVSHNDLWIAATTMQQGGLLLTTDQDFKHLPQINSVS